MGISLSLLFLLTKPCFIHQHGKSPLTSEKTDPLIQLHRMTSSCAETDMGWLPIVLRQTWESYSLPRGISSFSVARGRKICGSVRWMGNSGDAFFIWERVARLLYYRGILCFSCLVYPSEKSYLWIYTTPYDWSYTRGNQRVSWHKGMGSVLFRVLMTVGLCTHLKLPPSYFSV